MNRRLHWNAIQVYCYYAIFFFLYLLYIYAKMQYIVNLWCLLKSQVTEFTIITVINYEYQENDKV